ncbi:MAG: putative ABC transport system permease protein [Sulfitobacter sp.]|jgi:putative ABC transport system permease protein
MMNNLEIGPILRALTRNKVGAILIAIQIAFTMTIVVNAISIIQERERLMARESGLDDANTFFIDSSGFTDNFNEQVTIQEDLANIRDLPGVINAVQINAVPISGSGWSMGLQTTAKAEGDGTSVAVYMTDENGLETLDLELIAGENFSSTDVRWRERAQSDWPDKIIITKVMADELFPDQSWQYALGKTVFIQEDEPLLIIGIVDKLQAPWVGWAGVERSMLSPEYQLFGSARYLIRAERGFRDELMPRVEELLARSNGDRIIRNLRSIEDQRNRSYQSHSAMVKMLSLIMAVLILVTGLGIVGLASFNVNRRKKQIGVRRALGATQGAILRYFMVENFLISSIGVLLGAVLSVGLNIILVDQFSLTPIDWYLIPTGMLALWLVGQIAVFGPAQRAASISPASATRTV